MIDELEKLDELDDPDDDERAARAVLDHAIACTAFALGVAAIACDHVIGAWAAGWAYLVAIALAAWARSWLVVPAGGVAVAMELARADHVGPALGAAAAQLAIAAVVVVVVWRTRRALDDARALLREP